MKHYAPLLPVALIAATTLCQTPAFAQSNTHSNAHAIAHNVAAQLPDVRRATARFNDVQAALDAQYAPFADASGIYCIANPPHGAMGIHYVNGNLFSVPLEPSTPHALVYEPQANGKLRLVGVEYIVFQEAWDLVHASPPRLFGQSFHATPAGNRYGIPAFYALHVWLWEHNPGGLFADWNPAVRCP